LVIFSQEQLGGENLVGHPATRGNVVIGHDVWIGHGVTIMSGISIGNGTVIAAKSHVFKDVRPYGIVGGNPCKHIKMRFDQEVVDLLLKLEWWSLPVEQIKALQNTLCSSPEKVILDDTVAKFCNN
jgi:serine acetyltransferase